MIGRVSGVDESGWARVLRPIGTSMVRGVVVRERYRGQAGLPGEEFAEVGGFGEAESAADGGDGQVGVGQEAAGFQGDAGIDEGFGVASGGGLTGAVEGGQGVADPGGVVGGVAGGGEGVFEFVLEAQEGVACGGGGSGQAAVRGGESGDAQDECGEQVTQELHGRRADWVSYGASVFGGQFAQGGGEQGVLVRCEVPDGGTEGRTRTTTMPPTCAP